MRESNFSPRSKACAIPRKSVTSIGERFVEVQERILESEHFLDGHWILGQGTIYPDTIESAGTAKADLIKTHHNRVPGIQKLMETGRIVEPLASFYKDEVRSIGRELGIAIGHSRPSSVSGTWSGDSLPLFGHSGCAGENTRWVDLAGSFSRRARRFAYLSAGISFGRSFLPRKRNAARLINRHSGVNRVVAKVWTASPLAELRIAPAALSPERLARLRRADAVVRQLAHASGFDKEIWQFPVVLIPAGTPERPDSVVLRPIESIDGMTARAVRMPADLLAQIADALSRLDGIAGVFFDLTNKPPATIEWE